MRGFLRRLLCVHARAASPPTPWCPACGAQLVEGVPILSPEGERLGVLPYVFPPGAQRWRFAATGRPFLTTVDSRLDPDWVPYETVELVRRDRTWVCVRGAEHLCRLHGFVMTDFLRDRLWRETYSAGGWRWYVSLFQSEPPVQDRDWYRFAEERPRGSKRKESFEDWRRRSAALIAERQRRGE